MASPISTAYPTPETLIPKCFTISVSNIPSSWTALSAVPAQAGQKHRRLLDLSFFPVSHLKQCHLSHKLRFLRTLRFRGFDVDSMRKMPMGTSGIGSLTWTAAFLLSQHQGMEPGRLLRRRYKQTGYDYQNLFSRWPRYFSWRTSSSTVETYRGDLPGHSINK